MTKRPYINNADAPLWNAIKRLKYAKRRGAHPDILQRLEDRVSDEAWKVADKLGHDFMERRSDMTTTKPISDAELAELAATWADGRTLCARHRSNYDAIRERLRLSEEKLRLAEAVCEAAEELDAHTPFNSVAVCRLEKYQKLYLAACEWRAARGRGEGMLLEQKDCPPKYLTQSTEDELA